ncbi:MAG: hypothetical protein GXP16_13005 [Gammaproteobacteria bacterium]|nr:hypothetical protein [Gammaproteobacteria bacterium]
MSVGVSSLSYIVLDATHVGAWREFLVDYIGMEYAGDDSSGSALYRMDEQDRRVVVQKGDKDDIAVAGFDVADPHQFGQLLDRLKQNQINYVHGTSEQIAMRGVIDLVTLTDPSGLAIELSYGTSSSPELPFKSERRINGFSAGDLGLGHIVLGTKDIERSTDFYTRILGFKFSDFIHIAALNQTLTFLHCNPRHHTVALAPFEMPKRLLHFMVEMNNIDDVMTTYYLAREKQVPFANDLGRHTNDLMFSFYVITPGGFHLEIGCDGRLIDDQTWKVDHYDAPSIWGHSLFDLKKAEQSKA